MKNPFVYGESVIGNNFCDRDSEVEKLFRDLLDCQKIFLISPRRFGKSSLIRTVLEQIEKQNIKTVYLDIEGISTYKSFLNAYLTALIKESGRADRAYQFVRKLIADIRFDFSLDETGTPKLSLAYKATDSNLEGVARKIYNLPARIARGKQLVIVFDEFQEILKLNGGNIEGALRASIQHQRDVGYVFAGSQRHLLIDMATSPKRPFYKSGPVMYIDRIPVDIFQKFVLDKFEKSEIKVSKDALLKIFGAAENIPYYVQMISHELWDSAVSERRKVKERDIEIVVSQLVKQYDQNFRLDWNRLIVTKRQVLQTIANRGGRNILSKESLSTSELGYPSSVQATLQSLLNEGYIDKFEDEYCVSDILFREWIKSHTL